LTAGKYAGLVVSLLLLGWFASGSTQSATGTRSPHGNLNVPCQNCHTAEGWKPIRAVPEFNHNLTHYPLRGLHQNVACTQCHVKPVFSNVGTHCQDCHADIHKRQLGANCEQCHSVRGWGVSIKDIQQHSNRFPLIGAHAAVDCDSCHKNAANSQFQTMSTMCYSCHEADFKGTTAPNHVTLGYSTTCEQCHGTDTWLNAKFDHNTVGFPLTGGHAVPPRTCADCHVNNNFNLTSTACISCHQKDFQGTTNPNHVAGGFSTNCQQCHTTVAWQPAAFDHSQVNFPLTGAHTVPPRQCTDCHVNNNYNLTSTTCVSCHLKDFQGTTNPNHVAGSFSQSCDLCHTTASWQPATFDHSKSAFPLTGSHTVPPRQCTDCHVNNNYNITNTSCISCHQNDYNNAKSPVPHTGFPTTCEMCHDTTAWTDATFNHNNTPFPLTGSHTVPPRACADCHVNNNYQTLPTTCIGCHQTDYNNAKSPVPHTGFPTTCQNCHDTIQWTDGKFDHSQTGFPLTGSHTVPPRACTDCHINNNYNLTSTLCITCHQTDFNNANSPVPHTGFPTTCELCHDTIAWTDATFNHNNTPFPLTGSHTVPPRVCADCHVNNNYQTLPTACIGCHQTDYNQTTNPGHAAQPQFFPTTCQNCHNTTNWQNATFNHTQYTQFPINHGGANGVCSTCHTNSNNYSIFQCTNCHTQSQTDQNHQGVKGYVYNSVNCYQCHSSGGGGG